MERSGSQVQGSRPESSRAKLRALIEDSDPEPHRIAVRCPRLALVEPRLLIRACLSALLARGRLDAAGEAFRISSFSCAEELSAACRDLDFCCDLVVVNISARRLHEPALREELNLIQESLRETPLAVFIDRVEPDDAREAFQRGLKGLIPTRLPPDVVLQALRLIQAGGTYIPTEAFMAGASATADDEPLRRPDPSANFTRREWQVIERLRRGESNKAIAYELALHESTVKVYVRQIMRKLCATNRTHAAFLLSQTVDAWH